jgi:hypothetical protein
MIFLVCNFLVVITFGSTYLTCVLIFITWVFAHLNVLHFMFQFTSFKLGLILVPCFVFQSLSFELESILMFPTSCFKPPYLNFCPSWFIPMCFNPRHLSLSSSLTRCTIKCFTIVMKRWFFSWVPFIQMQVMINISLDLLIGTLFYTNNLITKIIVWLFIDNKLIC